MAAKLKYIKSLANSSVTAINLLSSFVFGGVNVGPYEPGLVYNKGDFIAKLDAAGNITVYKCLHNGVTGVYDESDWEYTTVKDNIGGGSAGVIVSELKPGEDEDHRVWWHVRSTIKGKDPHPEPIVVSRGSQVVTQEEKPLDENIILWLDIE